MLKHKLNKGFFPVVVLLLVCFTCTLLLALTNEITAPARAAQAQEAQLRSKRKIFPEADSFEELDLPSESPAGVHSAETAYNAEGELIGYLFSASAAGYGGAVPVYVGVSQDGKIAGLDLPANEETPGLGQKVRDAKFSTQFIGQSALVRFSTAGTGEGPYKWVEVDAVTAATISSNAAVSAINDTLAVYELIAEE